MSKTVVGALSSEPAHSHYKADGMRKVGRSNEGDMGNPGDSLLLLQQRACLSDEMKDTGLCELDSVVARRLGEAYPLGVAFASSFL